MEKLSDERLKSLLPALNEITRYVNDNISISDEVVQCILSTIKCESEVWAIDELKLWADIFLRARGISDNTKLDGLQNELLNRGIPEFPAVLALESILNKLGGRPPVKVDKPEKSKSVAQQMIIVEPSSLDFGVLKPGEVGVMRLHAKGGPISVTQKSNRFKVGFFNQGNNVTSVKVELRAGTNGEILEDGFIINTASGDIVVPVKARWISTSTTEPPLLSWCPVCKKPVGKKSLFYNKSTKQFECFSCKRVFPYDDPKVAKCNK